MNSEKKQEELITKGIDFRNKGFLSLSIEVLKEAAISQNTRAKIHLSMTYLVAGFTNEAFRVFLDIPKEQRPEYLVDAMLINLWEKKELNLERMSEFSNDLYFLIFNVDLNKIDSSDLILILEIFSGESEDKRRRLFPFLKDVIFSSFLREGYVNSRIDISSLLSMLLGVESFNVGTIERILCERLNALIEGDKKVGFEDEIINLLSNTDNEFNGEVDKIIVKIQSLKHTNFYTSVIFILCSMYLFPRKIKGCKNKLVVRYGNFYYRFFHFSAKYLKDDSIEIFNKCFKKNGIWHGNMFVKGCISYFRGELHLTSLYYDKVSSQISDLQLSPDLIASLGHITSALCWKPIIPDVNKPLPVIPCLPLTPPIENMSNSVMYVLGADSIYADNFLDVFLQALKLQNREESYSVTLNVLSSSHSGGKTNATILQKFKGESNLNISALEIDEELTPELTKPTQFKGIYTLLRYYNINKLMRDNPSTELFIISDIDAYPQYSSEQIYQNLKDYDVVVSAIKDQRDWGCPSYVGAGCLAIRNNENGRKFADNLVKCLAYFNNRSALNKWNLDQASIRYAMDSTENINVGFFPIVGNVLKFANAYSSKEEFVEETKKLFHLIG